MDNTDESLYYIEYVKLVSIEALKLYLLSTKKRLVIGGAGNDDDIAISYDARGIDSSQRIVREYRGRRHSRTANQVVAEHGIGFVEDYQMDPQPRSGRRRDMTVIYVLCLFAVAALGYFNHIRFRETQSTFEDTVLSQEVLGQSKQQLRSIFQQAHENVKHRYYSKELGRVRVFDPTHDSSSDYRPLVVRHPVILHGQQPWPQLCDKYRTMIFTTSIPKYDIVSWNKHQVQDIGVSKKLTKVLEWYATGKASGLEFGKGKLRPLVAPTPVNMSIVQYARSKPRNNKTRSKRKTLSPISVLIFALNLLIANRMMNNKGKPGNQEATLPRPSNLLRRSTTIAFPTTKCENYEEVYIDEDGQTWKIWYKCDPKTNQTYQYRREKVDTETPSPDTKSCLDCFKRKTKKTVGSGRRTRRA
jgi:hypothetical protein